MGTAHRTLFDDSDGWGGLGLGWAVLTITEVAHSKRPSVAALATEERCRHEASAWAGIIQGQRGWGAASWPFPTRFLQIPLNQTANKHRARARLSAGGTVPPCHCSQVGGSVDAFFISAAGGAGDRRVARTALVVLQEGTSRSHNFHTYFSGLTFCESFCMEL